MSVTLCSAVNLGGWGGQIYFHYARTLLAVQDWQRVIGVSEAGLMLTPYGLEGANLHAHKGIALHSLGQIEAASDSMDSAWAAAGHFLPELFPYYWWGTRFGTSIERMKPKCFRFATSKPLPDVRNR